MRLKARYHGTWPNQMFVETLVPDRVQHQWPIVLVHGSALSGSSFLTTPDGRDGWAQLLTDDGWACHVVDWPQHGRSGASPDLPYQSLGDVVAALTGLLTEIGPSGEVRRVRVHFPEHSAGARG